MYKELFEVVTTASGAKSIRHKILNETMHNPVGPWAEAHDLYVIPSRLHKLLNDECPGSSHKTPLVVFDIGLGAGTNAVAALHCKLGAETGAMPRKGRPLEVVSFELDLRLLAFALSHSHEFSYLEPYRDALESVLNQGSWQSPCGQVKWRLHHGSFIDTLPLEKSVPEIIFYDPYSPKVNGDMWTIECFKALYEHCKSQKSILLTYSIATPIRAALLVAGFFVGHGPRSGLKHETTQASTDPLLLDSPLAERWFERWKRSHTKFPYEIPHELYPMVIGAIENHPQFRGSTFGPI
jgi:tRNA U34 5-methylaminomethyl-2-thiouridine-forming methyltransferase MnmC